MNYRALTDAELVELLKREDQGSWEYVLETLVDQEKKSAANNCKRFDWSINIEDVFGDLYNDMVGRHFLDKWRGGSIFGWMRMYMRGYLSKLNPDRGQVDINGRVDNDADKQISTLEEKISFELSERNRRESYVGEDLHVLRNESWQIVQQCFKELWKRNSMQAYVMLLKTRFHMSSLEIKDRFGLSSAANVDQMFSRAVKKMKEAKVKYET